MTADTPRAEDPVPVPSPCINICRMNDATGWCDGCLRTIDEIANWSFFDESTKRSVWDALEARHAQLMAQREDIAMNAPARVVTIGERFSSTLALSADSVKSFATLVNDLNPLHHDDAYAAQSRFGGLIASGTQPSAHLMALVATHFSHYAQPLGLEFDIKLKQAVRSDDTLTFTWQVRSAFWKPSLNGDLVQLDGNAVNQRDETVMLASATVLVMPKSAAPHANEGRAQ
jgi:predicted Fe-S protein YdhL (DUF1289 family)